MSCCLMFDKVFTFMFDKTYTMKSMNIIIFQTRSQILAIFIWNLFSQFSEVSNYMKSFTLITMKSWQNIYDEIMTKHLRRNHDKTYTMKSWQNIYDEIMTKHIRRSLDKTYTFITMKKSWKFMRVEMRVDLTIYPKHYFCWIQQQNERGQDVCKYLWIHS